MNNDNRLRQIFPDRPEPGEVAIYARSAADDDAGTACQRQVCEALASLEEPAGAAIYTDARKSGLDADRPAIRRLLVDVRRGHLRRVVVRDLSRLARDVSILDTILTEFQAAGVELVTIKGGKTHA